jgi:hypothetical protein
MREVDCRTRSNLRAASPCKLMSTPADPDGLMGAMSAPPPWFRIAAAVDRIARPVDLHRQGGQRD